MPIEVIVRPPDELASWFVADLAREIRASAAEGRRFTLAVPGGSVAERFLPRLAAAPIDWSGVDIFWTDERAVRPDDPSSNHGLARRLWLEPAGVPASRVHRMPAEQADLDAAADSYAATLCAVAGSPPVLDYVLLGAGEDGHVASVFDTATADRVVAWTDSAPKPPARRMTLTLGTLARARRVVIAGFGERKAQLLAAAAAGEGGAGSPLSWVVRRAARVTVLRTPR